MNTKMISIDPENINISAIKEAASILKLGGLVAFPTETVYGLGANALDKEAASKIYSAKGRPSDNPLIVHIADMDMLPAIVSDIPTSAVRLAEAFWPGPLTMVFRKTDLVPFETTGGLSSVAVRMPQHPIALSLIRESTGYIAAPSANTSGRPSPTLAKHVLEDMDGQIDMIIDGGMVGIGLESTIIDLTEEAPVILRPGYITKEMLELVIGDVLLDKALSCEPDANIRPKAPGMKYRHYAPKGNLSVVEGTTQKVIEKINLLSAEKIKEGYSVGIIGTDETIAAYEHGLVRSIGSREDEHSIALHLYSLLREFDELEVDFIYSEAFETPQMGQAIMNRLLKAAGHNIIEAY